MTTETEDQGSLTQAMLWLGGAILILVALAYFVM